MALNYKENEEEQQGLRYQVRKRISPLPLNQTHIPEYYYSRVSPMFQVKTSRGEPALEGWSIWEGRNGLWSPSQVEQNCSPSLFLCTPTSTGRPLTESYRERVQTEHWSNDELVIVHPTTSSENIQLEKNEESTIVQQLPHIDETIVMETGNNSFIYPSKENSIRSSNSSYNGENNNVVWLAKTNNQIDALQNNIPVDEKSHHIYLLEQAESFYSDSLSNPLEEGQPLNTSTKHQCSIQFINQLNNIASPSNENFSNTEETQYLWKSSQSSHEMPCSSSTNSKKKSVKDDLELRTARIMRNREAAQRSRQNAKAKFQNLEMENKRLRSSLYVLEQENFWLRKQVELVKSCVEQLTDNKVLKSEDM
ncbi:hypothetical protein GpartN1_g5028.t1 [Galdieria partita]|uniref:BZIP domain-containing protein n=1 Tax=Galdieria partita TaxID=83374 RepID=A0A9C7US56_9RHOD|nr:hypothetical protein GpartN1_g5028.t1 [Galdieria partita]